MKTENINKKTINIYINYNSFSMTLQLNKSHFNMKYFFQDKIIWAAINMYFVAQKIVYFYFC